ncbi:hypothetical protein PA25_36210 [Pseudoalteromonas sp. A25]|uniref:M14-type cytosolic carboxypeptidase n=1 Tax=Pseudoalteromonas sp. A25 TaxID=116092 RepID=UPI0012613580|nr:M14-type cytosolic carboxypeptidase [Pseudoalteromonas sp. A25]BBN83636.1 hypothetical protein PA25_36210 [Pseudoalteromonas sp. A25]
MAQVHIDTDFDGGAIEVLSAKNAQNILLNIKKDSQACTKQWFYFAVQATQSELHHVVIANADEASFANAWQGYQAFASYNNQDWFRVNTHYQNGQLLIEHQATEHTVYYAYFVPYTQAQQTKLSQNMQSCSNINEQNIGYSVLGQAIKLTTFGNTRSDAKKIWIIARQHPGETMAQWIADGLLNHFLSNAEQFTQEAHNIRFFVVANMNPDGSNLGNHRTNAAGANLNRQWLTPDLNTCPEVYCVKQAMEATGVDLLVDVHGDEQLAYNFMMVEGQHPVGESIKIALAKRNRHFQLRYDYANQPCSNKTGCCGPSADKTSPCDTPCKSAATATSYVYQQFDVPAILLETSFKALNTQHNQTAWDHIACQNLGADLLEVLHAQFT